MTIKTCNDLQRPVITCKEPISRSRTEGDFSLIFIHKCLDKDHGIYLEWIDDYNFHWHSFRRANIAVVAGFDVVINIERWAEFGQQHGLLSDVFEGISRDRKVAAVVPFEREFDVYVGNQQGTSYWNFPPPPPYSKDYIKSAFPPYQLPMPYTVSNV